MNPRAAGQVAAALFLLVGGGQVYMALGLPRGSLAEPGPALFPLLVGALMCVASLLCLVRATAENHPVEFDLRADATRLAILVAAIGAFVALLPRVGFIVPALMLELVTLQVFGMRGFWRRAAVAVAVTAVAVILFEVLLGVRFPDPTWRR
jgi:L-lactate permease